MSHLGANTAMNADKTAPRSAIEYQEMVVNLLIEPPRCAEAIEWYAKVFGFEETFRLAEEKKRVSGVQTIQHAALKLGNINLYLQDFTCTSSSISSDSLPTPRAETKTFTFYLRNSDADAVMAKALEEGAKMVSPVEEQFWGARFGLFRDPFGYQWGVATHLEKEKGGADVSA